MVPALFGIAVGGGGLNLADDDIAHSALHLVIV